MPDPHWSTLIQVPEQEMYNSYLLINYYYSPNPIISNTFMCIWRNGQTDKRDLDTTSHTVNFPSTAHQAKYQIIKPTHPFLSLKGSKLEKSTYYSTIWTEQIDDVGLSSSIFLLPKQIEATFLYKWCINVQKWGRTEDYTTRQHNVHKLKANDK